MNKFLIAGNWKMNKLYDEAIALVDGILNYNAHPNVEKLIFPPYLYLNELRRHIDNQSLSIGAQNCYYENNGAFTGEVSADMLNKIGMDYCIIGHSERRTIFGEDDVLINNKVKSCFDNNIKPVLCIGETLKEREDELTFNVIEKQLKLGLKDIPLEKLSELVIAYEPVWAIGTGVSASPEQAGEAHNYIRKFLVNKYGNVGNEIFLLYGGSMKPENAESLLNLENINGGLIGGASLDADKFNKIVEIALSID